MAYLELKDIHKSYHVDKQEFKVLKGIDSQFERGEFVSILGESGGGKTTLMNIIAGLDSKYDGDVILNGNSLKLDSNKQLDEYRRNTIGFIFQSFNLVSHLSILDNVKVSLEMTKLSHKEQDERARELLQKVGLGDHLKKYPNQLSGGQKQRVSIARALASDPDIIIADEPTGALDAQNTDDILKLMNEIAEDGKLVIAVTHSQVVADYGTRVVHLADGKIDKDTHLKEAFPLPNKEKSIKSRTAKMSSVIKMAFRHFSYNLKRNLLIMFGAAIGIFSVIFMLGLGNGVKGYINHEIYSQINPSAVQISKKVNTDDEQPNPNKIALNDSDVNRIKKVNNVQKVEKGSYQVGGQVQSKGKNATVQYVQSYYDGAVLTKNIKRGTTPKGDNEIIINKSTAQKFNKKHPYDVAGKKVTLFMNVIDSKKQPHLLKKKFKVSGVTNDSNPAAYPTYDGMKEMFKAGNLPFNANVLSAKVQGGVKNVQPAQDKIKAMKDSNGKARYQLAGAGSIIETLNTYINLAVYVLAAIAGISLLVSAIMIIVVLYISVAERTKEIGILRALGFSRRNIRWLFISEAIFLGFFSSVFSVIISYLLQAGVNNLSTSGIGYSIMQVSPGNAIFGIVVSVVICLLAALAPSGKAAKVDPVVSLSAE
ncbi:ATP-binding cassette domain-containing protein [Lactobacillus sp. S2-2]|uniref:ABC transporter ATP-binding protein/permease n=1 Tax=Lactobacillus sp. S2-2 TaxID=2692917 RepID=UPI001F01F4F6|nr:ABC transporter ATP-binding protein/permease [Lactobacillus sp. S2-2]MCF6515239.1 ATP-binding cassette domain-containing protein [Lactobacillus sp. S2-2]